MEENRNVNNVPAEGNEDSINFSIHDLIQMVIGNWFWFLLSTVVCLSCALFYIYTAPKVYNRTATILIKDGKKGSGGADSDEDPDTDPMFKQAVEVVIDAGQASTSLLQRRCKLGYARAARIMDEMEQKGVIGPYEGAKPRAVLISRQQWLEMQMNQPEE